MLAVDGVDVTGRTAPADGDRRAIRLGQVHAARHAGLHRPSGRRHQFHLEGTNVGHRTQPEPGGGRLRRERLGIVLPQPSDNLLDRFDAVGDLMWAARQRHRDAGERRVTDPIKLLESVGLGRRSGQERVRQLSGGEQQRLAIACALVGDPTLVVADEPTASLDRASAGFRVVEVLRAAGDRGVTLLVAGHDRRVIDAADAVVELDHGRRVA